MELCSDMYLSLPANIRETVTYLNSFTRNDGKQLMFGGSFGLRALGLINRPIKDIDIFISDFHNSTDAYSNADGETLGMIIDKSANDPFVPSATAEDELGNEIKRIVFAVNGINVCLFKVPFSNYYPIEWGEEGQLHIQDIAYALGAKRAYLNNKKVSESIKAKHRQDLEDVDTAFKQAGM